MTYVNDVDQIYIPPLPNLIALQNELIAHYPQLTSRAIKAVDIIVERRIGYDPAARCWTAESKRDGGRTYQLIGQSCTCPDYNSTFSPIAGNHRWCKHKLAKRLYTEHLERQINERLVSLTDLSEVTPECLRTDGMFLYDAYRPIKICRIRRDSQGTIRLFDSAAIHQFSLWMLDQIVTMADVQALAIA